MAVKNTRAFSKRIAKSFGNTQKNSTAAMIVVTFSLTLCFCLLTTTGAASIHKRSAVNSATDSASNTMAVNIANGTCALNSECGWSVYTPFSRQINYYIKNRCDCDKSMACLRAEDNLSMHAYTFRCRFRQQTTNTTEVTP